MSATSSAAARPPVAAATAPPPAVEVRHLTAAYRDLPALWDIDLRCDAGRMTAIVGPNGAGKSTLLKCMLGLVTPVSGGVRLLGGTLAEARGRVAYVPQRGSVDWEFPTTVRDVVLMGTYGRLGWLRRPGRAEALDVAHALDQVGLTEVAGRQISRLSGGQQQRVFLARALVQGASLYLLDEPFQGVDAATERAIVGVLHRLRDEGRTVVAVHHDLATAGAYFDAAALLNVRLIAVGPVGEALTAENLRRAYGAAVGPEQKN